MAQTVKEIISLFKTFDQSIEWLQEAKVPEGTRLASLNDQECSNSYYRCFLIGLIEDTRSKYENLEVKE